MIMNDGIASLWALCTPAAAQGGLLVGLFVAGAAGSAMHCVPMCGGFVLGQVSQRLQHVPTAQLCEWRRLQNGLLLPYHLGRLTTYALLGALAAASATIAARASWLSGLSSVLLMLAAGLFLAHAASRLLPAGVGIGPATAPAFLARGIGRLTQGLDRARPSSGYLLGLALGLLPCGFLYGALIAAAASTGPARGAVAMVAFGLGTMPALMIVGIAGHAAGVRCRRLAAWVATPVLVINALLLLGLAVRSLTAFS